MKWSPQQEQARRLVSTWMRDSRARQTLYLAGYAGTGKSTIAKDLVAGSNHRWLFAAYTGRTRALPYKGDRLVCLRNNRETGVFNGSQWVVIDASYGPSALTGNLTLRSEDDGRLFEGKSWLHYFLGRGEEIATMGRRKLEHDEFDWSYALTVHKAQGSQWDRVLVFDESDLPGTDPRRWIYTAVTRAAKYVAVLA